MKKNIKYLMFVILFVSLMLLIPSTISYVRFGYFGIGLITPSTREEAMYSKYSNVIKYIHNSIDLNVSIDQNIKHIKDKKIPYDDIETYKSLCIDKTIKVSLDKNIKDTIQYFKVMKKVKNNFCKKSYSKIFSEIYKILK